MGFRAVHCCRRPKVIGCHLTELQASRHLIGILTGRAAMPQLVIRVGQPQVLNEVPPMTPRRPLSDVLAFHRDASS
jgi:hypothetical protein